MDGYYFNPYINFHPSNQSFQNPRDPYRTNGSSSSLLKEDHAINHSNSNLFQEPSRLCDSREALPDSSGYMAAFISSSNLLPAEDTQVIQTAVDPLASSLNRVSIGSASPEAFSLEPPPGLRGFVSDCQSESSQTRRIRNPLYEQSNPPFSRHTPLSVSLSDLAPNPHSQNGFMPPAPQLGEGVAGFSSNFHSGPQGANLTPFHQSASLDLMIPSRVTSNNRWPPHLPASTLPNPMQHQYTPFVGYPVSALDPISLGQLGPQAEPSLFNNAVPGSDALFSLNRGDMKNSAPQCAPQFSDHMSAYVDTSSIEPFSSIAAQTYRESASIQSSQSPDFFSSERQKREADSFSYDWGLQLSNYQTPHNLQPASSAAITSQMQVLTIFFLVS